MTTATNPALAYDVVARSAPPAAVDAATKLLALSRDPQIGDLLSRAMEALAVLAAGMDRRAIVDAAGAPSNVAALLRLLEHSASVGALAGDDPLADAHLRWVRDRRRLLFADGRPLPSKEVADLLGMSRQAVAKARADGRLVGLPTGRGTYVYPSWQFGPAGPLAGLRDLRRALGDDDPWTLTAFVVAPNSRLDDETPLAVLRRGDLPAVIGAARAYGEHGAS